MKSILKALTLTALLIVVAPAQAMCNHVGNMVRVFGTPLVKATPFIAAYKLGEHQRAVRAKNIKSYWANRELGYCKTDLAKIYSESYDKSFKAYVFTRCLKDIGYSRDEMYINNISYALQRSQYDREWTSVAKKLQTEFDEATRDRELLFSHFSV